MDESGVAFGTSGARGKADRITDRVAYIYTAGFLGYLMSSGALKPSTPVAVGGDLRPSTDRIISAAGKAIIDLGFKPVYCGKLPSPALALYGIQHRIPAVMVTGSHIPGDENGMKFTTAAGEITKNDEAGIRQQCVAVPDGDFSVSSDWRAAITASDYTSRYTGFFPADFLKGITLGVYEHSTVGRDLFARIYSALGADIIPFGRSGSFVPVDTEAIREEDHKLAAEFAENNDVHAVVSADGDSDRPLLSDEAGRWIRGDILGVLTAQFLGAEAIATPVSCNSTVEACGSFKEVIRTKIGSPYVIEGMKKLEEKGYGTVAGYEANGGFLLQTPCEKYGKSLQPLPTRDSVIVHLAVLGLSLEKNIPVSELVKSIQHRFTASDRLQKFPRAEANKIIADLANDAASGSFDKIENLLGPFRAEATSFNCIDGFRVTFKNNLIVHLRASGNSDDFRCYAEADDEETATAVVRHVLFSKKMGTVPIFGK